MSTNSKPLIAAFSFLFLFSVLAGTALSKGLPPRSSDHNSSKNVEPYRLTFTPSDSVIADEKTTSLSKVCLAVTNYGFFGNNFRSRAPSFEYPCGSGIDHMVRGGIWIGGFNTDIGETLVSTSTVDGYAGGSPIAACEFTPHPDTTALHERSTLPHSKYYVPTGPDSAISEQDFIAKYSDIPGFTKPGGEDHVPLKVDVRQETYCWSFKRYNAFVLVRLFIKNICGSGCFLKDVYVGLYSELASGYKPEYPTWPTSGWYAKKDIEYSDSLSLCLEHHYQSEDGLQRATSWSGIQYLGSTGSPPSDTLQTVSFNWWTWRPGATDKDTDVERYRLMSNGEIDDASGVEANQRCPTCDPVCRDVDCDPVQLISVGPFKEIGPDSTIVVCFAFVAGDNRADLIKNAAWAKEVYNSDFVTYTPPPSPRLKIFPRKGELVLRWDNSSRRYKDPKSGKQDFEGFRIYESKDNLSFNLIKEVDLATDTIAYNTGLDEIDLRGDSLFVITPTDAFWCQYGYTLGGLKDGFKYWLAVTAFDTGEIDVQSLESGLAFNKTLAIPGPAQDERGSKVVVFPNPYRGRAAWDGTLTRDRFIWFANLPPRAQINIYSLSGDLIDTIDFDAATYAAQNARGVVNPGGQIPSTDEGLPKLSGSMCAWDMLTSYDQIVATGLYIFSVKDKDTGKVELGKFLILR
ncbi:MAG: hypothetical protein QME66_11425 [Candidatus Eisenbacteria bacterium]|nr:hypothetical protein [Candidatus Eisenbacteria bacterium]